MQSKIKLTNEQIDIGEGIIERCLAGKHTALTGLAGTGKTTVAQYVYDRLSGIIDVLPMAPTGKAASVLRNKGVPAHTIHSVIYSFRGSFIDDDGEEQLLFNPKDGSIAANLLMIDEASMVSSGQFRDIMDKDVPSFWVGDPGQLPPVQSERLRLLDRPTYSLTTIHRQAADNPIIRWAHKLRSGQDIYTPEPGINRVSVGNRKQLVREILDRNIDVVITKTNEQRIAINQTMCDELQGGSWLPQIGSRLICLRNHKWTGLVNGDLLDVIQVRDVDKLTVRRLSDGEEIRINIALSQLNNGKRVDLVEAGLNPNSTILVDYGYALTCHKMQGSSARHVGIVAKGFCGDTRAWNYTSCTRAEEEITVFC